MVPANGLSSIKSFPTLEQSINLHPHDPNFTYQPPVLLVATPTLDTDGDDPAVMTTTEQSQYSKVPDVPFPWITSLITPSHPAPTPAFSSIHPSQSIAMSSASPLPDAGSQSGQPPPKQPQQSDGAITKGARIGMILGIVVVIVLTLFAIGFCLFDMNGRMRRHREKSQRKQESERNMWETELRNGRNPEGASRRKDSKADGLWDKLKVRENKDEARTATRDPTLVEYERRLHGVGMWEQVGDARNHPPRREKEKKIKKQKPSDRHEREHEWLPAYMPRERASIVSSMGSVVVPMTSAPGATNFLDMGDRR